MKTISILIPCFNEVLNVKPLSLEIINIFKDKLQEYDYEIIFIDNDSSDGTKDILRSLCNEYKKIKAIFNAKNYGQFNSPYYGMCQTTGDCTIMMCSDFQDPVELIPDFIKEWEKGFKIVSGIKASSKENKAVRLLRTVYYKLIRKMSDIEQIEHYTGFGLYDKSFIKIMSGLQDPIPFLRGIVAELGYKRTEIKYQQQKRRAGKTHNNLYTLYDAAMLSFTSYTKIGLRLATFSGFILSVLSGITGVIYIILKILYWERFQAGIAPILIAVLFLFSMQFLFIGILGEYIIFINKRIMNRPLVVEDERINF